MSNARLDTKFINELIETNKIVNIFLLSGICLTGTIKEEDEHSFLLTVSNKDKKSDNTNQIVYKRAVATIKPFVKT